MDLSEVRHPAERRILALSAIANVAVVAGAVAVILLAPGWLGAHPRAADLVRRIQITAVAAVVLLPVLGFLRAGRWMTIRLNSVRLGPDQLPQLHAILQRHCRHLGIPEPALYVSALLTLEGSNALSLARGERRVIVLGEQLFAGLDDLATREDVFAFVIGHELGRIVLGHASWWSELLLGYLKRIPVLRLPLVTVQTYSRDRVAARLAPGSVAALAMSASGGEIFGAIEVGPFVRDALAAPRGDWAGRIGAMLRKEPHLTDRIRELHRHGFFRPEPNAQTTSAASRKPAPVAQVPAQP